MRASTSEAESEDEAMAVIRPLRHDVAYPVGSFVQVSR